MAAAVADFTPADPAPEKIKKAGRERLELVLEPTADVLAGLAAARSERTDASSASPPSTAPRALELARGKLAAKGLDAIVVNDISRTDIGFDSRQNEVTILTACAGGEVRRAGRSPGRPRSRSPQRSSTWSRSFGRAR